ncbi:hypothetical protein [Desulfocicer vacuolatum]|uniref:hypothetical protein n=1 Tax=Desulfocicer vacuolatum TaxID=2298 RepID=UPI000A04F6D1|nr:hypothetical protein [Desulfocicer vacuolatum]
MAFAKERIFTPWSKLKIVLPNSCSGLQNKRDWVKKHHPKGGGDKKNEKFIIALEGVKRE